MAVAPGGPLVGEVAVPGDKSISHRALLLNALAAGRARVTGLSDGEDVAATLAACRAFGAAVERRGGEVEVVGTAGRLAEPDQVLDCGNSGTTIRLLLGALAGSGAEGLTVLTGDASLRRRPMSRVVAPLRAMGAVVDGRARGTLAPLVVRAPAARAADHDLAVASAQVKSAVLLAGLRTGVRVREPAPSRDHTERMLRAMGAGLTHDADGWWALSPSALQARDVRVPADLSAAAFLLVAGAVVPGSRIVLRGVGINPTRAGVLDVLAAMGADVRVTPLPGEPDDEPLADLEVRHGPLRGVEIAGELALRSLDELVVLAVAAAFADGRTTVRDAAELRVKESDRIARVAAGLRAVGVAVEEHPDGLTIDGGAMSRGVAAIDATGDHRIAMAFAVLGLAAPGGVAIAGADSVGSSWPTFFDVLRRLRGGR